MSTPIIDTPAVGRLRHTPPARGPIAKRIGTALLVLLVAVPIVVALLPDSLWKRLLVDLIKQETGREATIGSVRLHVLRANPELIVDQLRLANAGWAAQRPMLTVKHVDVTLSLLSLLKFELVFPRIAIDGPAVELERDPSGRANWDFSHGGAKKSTPVGNSRPAHLPVVRQLTLSAGKLSAHDALRKLEFDGDISISEGARPGHGASNDVLIVRGAGVLNGKPFDLRVNGGPLLNVDESKPYDFSTVLHAADIELSSRITIRHPFDLAAVSAAFKLSGKDLADLYYLTGLALPDTPPYELSGTVVRDKLLLTINDFHGRVGTSDLEGILAVDTGGSRPKLTANLRSREVNLADLAAQLGTQAAPEMKSDTLAVSAQAVSKVNPKTTAGKRAAEKVAAVDPQAQHSGYLLPDADLQINRVRAMDADVQYSASSVTASSMPMRSVKIHLLLNDGQLSLKPLQFDLPEGRFSGDVAIDARGEVPRTDIDMRLTGVDLTEFKPQSSDSSPLGGQLVGRIQLQGTGASVHKAAADADGDITLVIPQGDMRAAFAELAGIDVVRGLGLLLTQQHENTEIRCGVMSFHATRGILEATTLVLDTQPVLVTGSGNINLDNETLDLDLRGQPKQATLLRLRTPIVIRGTLSRPRVGLDAGKLAAQTGGALVLGALLTPVAGLLAFVDPGLAKNANCAQLLSQAKRIEEQPSR
jgi:uncharacterized protein involved in outer membrane biogenesis